MAVLTAQCDRIFSIDKDKLEAFNNVQPNQKIREESNKIVTKISSIITIDENVKQ